MSVIEVCGVSHTYGGEVRVLDDVSFSVEKGEFVSILGASGSGKTTLLSIMGGIERPTEGKVFIDGEEISSLSERKLAILRRTKISFVFQFFNLAPYLTVEQNILVPVFLAGKRRSSVANDLEDLLKFMGLTERRSYLPSKLSGGEQQRTAIARGLIVRPEIIFLDEPTGNLDSKNSEEIMRLLSAANKEYGTTVVQVTHSEKNAGYGSRIITIKDGKISSEAVGSCEGGAL